MGYPHPPRHTNARDQQLLVIWIIVTPVPVNGLLLGFQLNERTRLVVLTLIPLVRAVFIAIPSVIVLVFPVVVPLIVFDLLVFLVPVVSVSVVLWAGGGHHRNRGGESGS